MYLFKNKFNRTGFILGGRPRIAKIGRITNKGESLTLTVNDQTVPIENNLFSSFMVVNIGNNIIKKKICPDYPHYLPPYPFSSLF
jgi:hypothetical protein